MRVFFLEKLKPLLETHVKREDAVKRLEELAIEAHDNCMNEKFEALERLRWTRIEAYVYQRARKQAKKSKNPSNPLLHSTQLESHHGIPSNERYSS